MSTRKQTKTTPVSQVVSPKTRKVSRGSRRLTPQERERQNRKVERVLSAWTLRRDGSYDQFDEWQASDHWSGPHDEFRCVSVGIWGRWRCGRLQPYTWMLSYNGQSGWWGFGNRSARGRCKSITDALEQAAPLVKWVAREGFRREWSTNLHPVFEWDRATASWRYLLVTPKCASAFVKTHSAENGLPSGVYATAEEGRVGYLNVTHWGSGGFSFLSKHDMKDAPGIQPLEWEGALAILEAAGDFRLIGLLREEKVRADAHRASMEASRRALAEAHALTRLREEAAKKTAEAGAEAGVLPQGVHMVGGPAHGRVYELYTPAPCTLAAWNTMKLTGRYRAAFLSVIRRPLKVDEGGGSATELPRMSAEPLVPTEAQQQWAVAFFKASLDARQWTRHYPASDAERATFTALVGPLEET